MKKNIGTLDRIWRCLLAILLMAYAWWQMSFIAAGLSLFVFYEALAGWCILYQLIGKNSCSLNRKDK